MTIDPIKQAQSLATRTSIMLAQQQDLTRKFEELHAAQLKLIQELRDAAAAQAA